MLALTWNCFEQLGSAVTKQSEQFCSLSVQHNTMESLLERGEKLDDLVSKSEVLGTQSKAFYKTVSPALASRGCCTQILPALCQGR